MELTYATIVILASMVFVLSGMVGYLYWQQTRMLQHIQSLAMVVSTHLVPPPVMPEVEDDVQEEPQQEDEEDDRLSVKEEIEHVEGPKVEEKPVEVAKEKDEDDVDDLQDKTAAQLREMLTKKGIPFGKRDSKSVLIQLLKATA